MNTIIKLILLNLFISKGLGTQNNKTIDVVAVGDMMIGTNYPSEKYLPNKGGSEIFDEVKYIIKEADLAFGNLEGTILSGEGEIKNCNDITKCYAFKSPDEYVKNYKDAGFDILSLANNHINDFGKIGRDNTTKLLKENEIYFSGTIESPYSIFTKDNIRFGFTAFSPNKGTLQINDYDKAVEIVKYLDLNCDVVIVSFHGGGEGSQYNRVNRKREYFLGEDRGNPYEFSRVVIDAGADLVFGHGPHVVRAIDLYKNRIIAYSLGNFATYGRFNLSGIRGLAPILKVKINDKGEFLWGKILSAKQKGLGIPTLDYNNEAAIEISRLTKVDFPKSLLKIDRSGNIEINKTNK
tara:strand:+ start:1305 stop:2357 length:1053 start_codon:yes stop_codon:yes gene_type:complete